MTCGDKRGENAGYTRHVKAGEKPCDECREAHNAHKREWRWRTGRSRPRSKPKCGTPSGRTRHTERGESPCGPCKEAFAVWQRRHRFRQTERVRMHETIVDVLTTHDRWLNGEVLIDMVLALHPEWKANSVRRKTYALADSGVIERDFDVGPGGRRVCRFRPLEDSWERVA